MAGFKHEYFIFLGNHELVRLSHSEEIKIVAGRKKTMVSSKIVHN